MSKLIENKHMIHIMSEIVVLLGLTFYFNQKNKKIMGHIQDLSQRIEEQEDLLQKHEQVIRKLVDFIGKNQSESTNTSPPEVISPNIQNKNQRKKSPTPTPTPTPPTPTPTLTKAIHTKPPLVAPVLPKPEPSKVTFDHLPRKSPPMRIEEVESEEDESEDESDLDTELAEELGELEDSDSHAVAGLKKRE